MSYQHAPFAIPLHLQPNFLASNPSSTRYGLLAQHPSKMVLKQTYHAHERTTFVVGPVTRWLKSSLTPAQYKGLQKLPKELLLELEQFIERNTLATVYDSHCKIAKKEFCKPCLKAHAFVMADAMGLGKEGFRLLNQALDGKEGHEGYYLDEELLISLDGKDL